MPSTDIKDYWRRSWGIGDRKMVGKPGGLVEPGVKYYAKAKYDDPRSGIKVGDDLGTGIQQKQYLGKKKLPRYVVKAGEARWYGNTFEKAAEARVNLLEEIGGLKQKAVRTKTSWETLSKDPLFKKFFKEQIETNENIKKAMKANKLTKDSSLKTIYEAFSKEASKSDQLRRVNKVNPSGVMTKAVDNFIRTFESTFKLKEKHAGKLTVKELVTQLDDLGIKTDSNMIRLYLRYTDPNYKEIKYPIDTKAYREEKGRLATGKNFRNTLEELGIKVETVKNPKRKSRAKDPTAIRGAGASSQYRFSISKPQLKKLAKSYFFEHTEPVFRILDKFSSQSKASDEYRLNKYRKDSENIASLKRNLNKTIGAMSDNQLRNWVKKNPRLKNLVETYFDAATGEIKKRSLSEIPDNKLRWDMQFERDHIRGRSTVKYDPVTKKILDGIGLEYPKNLYIIPRGINNSTKQLVENWVASNPKETKKIKEINKWFKSNDLTYWDKRKNKYRGATPKITNTDLSHLGLTVEEILLNKKINPKTGELVIEKGPGLEARIKERNKFLLALNKKYKPIIQQRLNSGLPVDDILKMIAADLKIPQSEVIRLGGKVLRGLGKAAVVLDPMFAAFDASHAFGEGASGKQATSYTVQRFFEGLVNLPALAYGGAKWAAGKATGKDTKFEMPYEATFAQDYLKRSLDATPENIKQRRKAEIEFQESMPMMVDYMEMPGTREEWDALKEKFMKEKFGENYEVTHPKKSPKLEIKETDNILGTEVPTKNLTGVDQYIINRGI